MPLHILVGAQWGDEGKGRITDLLAADAAVVARFSGGDNAGHTVTVNAPGGPRIFKLHLLPSGLVEVDGQFRAGEVVALTEAAGVEFARGLVNYDAEELRRIRGAKTADIEKALGYKGFDEVVHRDNLVIL